MRAFLKAVFSAIGTCIALFMLAAVLGVLVALGAWFFELTMGVLP